MTDLLFNQPKVIDCQLTIISYQSKLTDSKVRSHSLIQIIKNSNYFRFRDLPTRGCGNQQLVVATDKLDETTNLFLSVGNFILCYLIGKNC